MKTVTRTGDGKNTIFTINEAYIAGTVKVYLQVGVDFIPVTNFEDLGEGNILLYVPPKANQTVKLDFTPFEEKKEEEYFKLKQQLKKLETDLEGLREENKQIKEALNHRINITTFNAWLTLLERKLDVSLISDNLSYINKELHISKR